MAQTLKEYIEEQRKLGAVPYFTNIPPEEGGLEDVFRYEEKPFTEQTERELEDPLAGFRYSEDVPGLIPEEPQEFSMAEAERARRAPPPKPTAETVTPGGEIPEAERKRMGLSPAARYAMDQQIPEAKEKIPAKPPAEELTPQFKDRKKFRDRIAGNIERRTGFNPLTFNYIEEAEKQSAAGEPDLFRKIFRGRKAYHMKDHLDPREKKVWTDALQAEGAINEDKLKFTSDQINKELEFGMKKFDDVQREKTKLPVAIKNGITGLYVTVNEEGKKVGQIPPGVMPKAIARAESYVNGGMSGTDAANKVTQELMQETMQIQAKTQATKDALAAIPGKGGWGVSGAEVKAAKVAVDAAFAAGATVKEVKNKLLDLEYPELHIARIMPAEGEATTVVSRETPGKKSKVREIKEAFQRGDYGDPKTTEARDKAKALMAKL